ncbi:hypothetical protein M5689_016918 [Euphorbia peplus]|nr:hypothetical protein M5689_016918 [Euphorbia peplus]
MSTVTPPAPAMASVPAPTMTTVTAPTLLASNIPAHYKNLLHSYIQKSSLPMAVYQSFNEGSVQWPRFRATVLVGEEEFASSNVFLRGKEAEHDAAKTALECLQKRIKEEEIPMGNILEGTIFCKSILHEYAVKTQMEMPVYSTLQRQGLLPVFASSVFLNGVTYYGENATTKKDPEQLAARSSILTLINGGDSTSSVILSEIIKSKSRFYKKDFIEGSTAPKGNDILPVSPAATEFHPPQQAVSQAAKEFHPPQQAVSEAAPEVHPRQAVAQAAPDVHPPQQAVSEAPLDVHPRQTVARAAPKVVKPVADSVQGATVEQPRDNPRHVFVVPKLEAMDEEIQLPIAFVAPTVDPCPDDGPSTGKRKNTNKSKSKHKIHRES